jgi:L-fuconolactonase
MLDERYLKEEYCKGIRHQIHDEKDPQWLLQPPVIESLKILAARDLPFDLVAVLPSHIEAALEVAREVPGLRMVFDHLSQPPISTGERFGRWGELMKEASKSKNFYAKISGLGTASGNFKNRVAGDVQPYTEFVLKHFGIDRCFCGSDWPVSLLANTYTGTWQIYKNVLKEMLAEGEQEKVFCTNAVKFYDLRFN